MIDIVDRYVRLTNAMGPAKGSPQPEKKKGDKLATANPAFKDGIAIQCKLCGNEHSAKDSPAFKEKNKKDAVKRGKIFPGQTDQSGRQRTAKQTAEDDDEESGEPFCLVCVKLKYLPPSEARTHSKLAPSGTSCDLGYVLRGRVSALHVGGCRVCRMRCRWECQFILLRTAVGVAVPFTCKQRWFDVQTARAPKQ
jgi:hypothetical protein